MFPAAARSPAPARAPEPRVSQLQQKRCKVGRVPLHVKTKSRCTHQSRLPNNGFTGRNPIHPSFPDTSTCCTALTAICSGSPGHCVCFFFHNFELISRGLHLVWCAPAVPHQILFKDISVKTRAKFLLRGTCYPHPGHFPPHLSATGHVSQDRGCLIELRETHYTRILAHKFDLGHYLKRFTCSNIEIIFHCSHTVHCCSFSFQPLSETLDVSSCLFKAPPHRFIPVCSVVIGQPLPGLIYLASPLAYSQNNSHEIYAVGKWWNGHFALIYIRMYNYVN